MNKQHAFKAFALTILAAALAGCHGSASSSSDSAADKSKPNFTVIRAGHPPFSTIITTTGSIQIVDFNENHKVILKKTKVQPNTLVTVNANDVSINTTSVSNKKLDRTHTYEIRLYK